MPNTAVPLPEKSPLAHSVQPPKQSSSAELATRATVPGDNEPPINPTVPGQPQGQPDEGFQEPELMKDESEDRE
jgi:hypothetical protein